VKQIITVIYFCSIYHLKIILLSFVLNFQVNLINFDGMSKRSAVI